MKTLFMSFVFMCAAAVPLSIAQAQITISQSDLNRAFAAGNNLVNRTDNVTNSVNIGSPGANVWDFRNLQTSTFQVFSSVSTSPWIGNFPGTTNTIKVDTSFQNLISGTIYSHLQLSSSGLRNLGTMGRATVFIGVAELRITVTPAEVVYKVPMTLDTVWHTAFTNGTRVTLNGQNFVPPTTTTHDATYTVDGYGTMQLPGTGNPIHALRIRKFNLYNGNPAVSFIFLSRGGAQISFDAAVPDSSVRSGTIAVVPGKTLWNTSLVPDSTTDVRISDVIPAEFALQQNYPNPFNPTTRITYQVAKAEHVSLKVFNLLGKEVAFLVNESKAPGTYAVDWNAAGLPSGVYFYRMQTNEYTSTKRMLVLK